jgi:type III secretion system low calcium response chaperone LcrH/SycD
MPNSPNVDFSNPFTDDDIKAMCESLKAGLSPAEASGIDSKQIEALYSVAHGLYKTAKFKEAEAAFKLLCFYDYYDSRFWMGLGATLQAREKFRLAADVYSVAALNDALRDPTPFYFAGICLLKDGDTEGALGSWSCLLELGRDGDPGHEAVKTKARKMSELVEARAKVAAK